MVQLHSLVAVVLTIGLPLTKACTGNYEKVPQTWLPTPINTCLYLCPQSQTETFEDARNLCLADNADLTTINFREELASLQATYRSGVWIGLTLNDDGTSQWMDGSDEGYISWAPGFPDMSVPLKKCVIVTMGGMENVDCNEQHNFLCERGLCQEYGGTCRNKNRHCCEEKMTDDLSECSGDSGMICCKPNSRGAGGGSGSGIVRPILPVTCSPSHQKALCEIQSKYIMYGSSGTEFTPAYHIDQGCDGLPLTRESECGSPANVCLKHRFLNLLECYNNTCDAQITITDLLDHSAYPDSEDFCNGRCIRIIRPVVCPVDPLKQMCEDVGGTYSEQTDVNMDTYATCCY